MSFILQLFHGPAVKTVQEAVDLTDSAGAATSEDRARFSDFVARVTRAYPNPDEDGEGQSAWPEGLSSGHHQSAVYNFMVDLDWLDENLFAHLGRAAQETGLKILDHQNGLLFPVDGQIVDMYGDASPLAEPKPVKPPRLGLPPGYDDEKEVNAKLASQLAAVLAPHGFAYEPETMLVVRQIGRVKQAIDIGAMKRQREISLYLRLSFWTPEIATLWQELLGEPVKAYVEHRRKTISRYNYDIHLYSSELRQPPSESANRVGASMYEETHDWEGAHAWLRQVVAWLKEEGLADLDRMKDPAGLAEFVLNDTQLEKMFRRNELLPHELFARLILMGAFDAARKDEWLRGYWDHYERSGLRFDSSPLRNFKALSEKVIAWLETEEFGWAADALRVRA